MNTGRLLRSKRARGASALTIATILAATSGAFAQQAAPPAQTSAPAAPADLLDAEIERLRDADNAAYQAGDYPRAIATSARVLELVRQKSGEHSADYARALDDHAADLYKYGRAAEAEPLFRRVLSLRTQVLGEKHPDTLTTLSNLAVVLGALGRIEEAEQLDRRALALRTEVLGEKHLDTLTSLNNLALDLHSIGRATEAEPLNRRALVLFTEVLGEKHPTSLTSLSNLAAVLRDLGRASEAEPLDRRVLGLRTAVLGEMHPDTLGSLNNLARDLSNLGRVDEAEPLDRRALALLTEVVGEKHPTTLTSLSNLAGDLGTLGRAAEAEPLDRLALALRTEMLGEKHPDTFTSLNNLALDLNDLGRPRDAEPLHRRALALSIEVLGEKHPVTLTSLSNLARDLVALGRAADAEPLDRRALAIRTEVLGEKHPDTLTSLNNLAADLDELGRQGEAEQLYARALQLRREGSGDDHPDTLALSQNFARNQLAQPARAHLAVGSARLALRGLEARYAVLGAAGAAGISQQSRDEGRLQRTRNLFAEAAWMAGPGLSDAGRAAGAPILDAAALAALRIEVFGALQQAQVGPAASAIAESAARRYAVAAGAGDLVTRRAALVQDYLAAERRQTAAQGAKGGPDMAAIGTERAAMEAINTQIKAIDGELALKAPQYLAIVNQPPLSLDDARKLLAPDEAVLMIVPAEKGIHLMALTDAGIAWQRANLSAAQLDAMVHRLRCDLNPGGEHDCGGAPAAASAAAATPRSARGPELSNEAQGLPAYDRATAYALYRTLVAPLADAIGTRSQLFVAASGSLASLPFGVLVTAPPAAGSDDRDPDTLRATPWLADRYALVQIPSLQSLQFLRTYNRNAAAGRGNAPVFAGYGDPLLDGVAAQRGSRTAGGVLATRDATTLAGSGVIASGGQLMDPARLRQLARLPGTKTELEAMRAELHAPASALHLEAGMTESAIKAANEAGSLAQVGILHLATHGVAARELGVSEPGLVFTPPATASDRDDGYLAASEVIGLNLTGTRFVILSACNTAAPSGQGEPGLSGLARAFFYAGAPSLLASHWPVDDSIAATLTVDILRRAATPGTSRAKALQQATAAIRNDGKTYHAHPSAWAPFTLVGEGR